MTEAKTKSSSRAKSQKAKSGRSKARTGTTRASSPRGGATKNDRVLRMLRFRDGATIAALVRATCWQPHSVRGFLAGVVKKKLGLNLASERTKAGRVYRVAAAKPPSASRPQTAEPAHG
jgi:hypothetical protein